MGRKYNVCENIDDDSVVNFLNKNMNGSADLLNIAHLNARSIPAHIDEISHLMTSTNLNIVGVSETWLRDGMPNCVFQVPGFSLLRNDRINDRTNIGGGVGIYVRNNLKVKLVNRSYQERFEALFVEVMLCTGKLLVGIMYNPRVCSIVQADELIEFLSNSMDEYHRIVIMGDFNLNMTDPVAAAKHFVDSMTSLSIDILPFSNTRLTSSLDLMMIGSMDCDNIIALGQTAIPGISDHDLIFMCYRYRHPRSKMKYQHVRDFSKLNEAAFLTNSLSLDWFNIYMCSDINSKVNYFNFNFIKLFNDHVPIKRKLCRNKSTPWFNNFILESIKKRDRTLLLWRKSKNPADWSTFTKLRNRTTCLIRDAKRKYYFDKLNNGHKNGNIWKFIKSLGMIPTNDCAVNFSAEDFKKQFSMVAAKPVAWPMTESNIDFCNEFNFIAFSESEVASNATGHDNIVPN